MGRTSQTQAKLKSREAEEARAEMQGMASGKRRRIGDFPVITAGDAVEPEASGGQDGEEQEVAAQGEGDRPEQAQKAVQLPVRGFKAKSMNRKTTSRRKKQIVNPRQQLFMEIFFKVKDAEETEKLEFSDCLNLDAAEGAGLGGAAAGVGLESEVIYRVSQKKRFDV